MPKVIDLNPTIGDVAGTDLGIPFRMPDGSIGFVLGDTFGGNRPRVGGPNWRSPVLLVSDTHDVTKPIRFTRAARGGRQLIDYAHNGPEYSTILPCDAVSIGHRIYLWVMYTKGLGNERWCQIWHSDDLGENWTVDPHRWSTSAFGGKRTMISWERGGDGFVYVASTGGLARDKNMLQWRVPEERILQEAFWEPWGYANGKWAWGNPPSDVLPRGTKLGEICLRRIQGNWILSGFDAGAYNAFVKVGPVPNSDWHTAPDFRPVKGMPAARGGPDIVPRLYGCYAHPDSKFGARQFGLIVSEWAVGDEPYRAMQYLVDVHGTPIEVKDETRPTAQEDWDMSAAEEVNNAVSGVAEPGKHYDFGREDGHNDGKRMLYGLVQRIAWELTIWSKELTLDELHKLQGKKATLLGFAHRAASWGRTNYLKLEQVGYGVLDTQVKLDKVLRNQKRLADKLGVTDIEE